MLKTVRISAPKETPSVASEFSVRVCVQLALIFVVAGTVKAQTQQYKFQQLNPPGSTYSFAFGINNNGLVVGSFVDATSAYEGYIYKDGKFKAIVFPGSVAFTQASGINDSNTVVGEFTGSDQLSHGYLLTSGGDFSRYDVATGASTYIYGINNAGTLTGFTDFQGQTVMGFVNIRGAVIKFTFMGNYTYAFGINNQNDVVGDFITSTFITHGFYRSASGQMTQIDYPGALETVCLGINDLGEISGYYLDVNNVAHGFVTKNAKFRTIPLPDAAGLNNQGSFVGSYVGKSQKNYGYVATPISPARIR